MSPRRTIIEAALYGSFTWAVYGVVEYFFAVVIPLLESGEYTLADWHWPLTAMLIAGYALIGFVGGGLVGLVLSFALRSGTLFGIPWYRAAGALSLVLVFAINLLANSPSRSSPLYIGFCLLPLWAICTQFCSNRWRFLAGGLTNPWALSVLLIAPFWVGRVWLSDTPRMLKAVVLLVTFAVLIGVVGLWQRLMPVLRPAAVFIGIAGLALVVSIALDREPPIPGKASTMSDLHRKTVSGPRPNVLLIVLDTVRADHLSLYGYYRDTTPNLKQFARAATIYTNAIATSDMSLGTHGSIFTGLYPSWHGAHYAPPDFPLGRPLDDKWETVAEVLSREGYQTLGVSANTAYLGPNYLLDQGFQYFDARQPVPIYRLSNSFYLRRLIPELPNTFAFFSYNRRRAKEINKEAIRLIEATSTAAAPLFLFLNYMDAHMPYLPPRPYDRMFPGRDEFYTARYIDRLRFDTFQKGRKITHRERNHISSQYDGQIAYLDVQLGRLFQHLKDRGLWDNTLIIVTSDHGEALGERNLLDHSVSVYQEHIHVPLVVKFPGQREGQTTAVPASHVDIFPTIIEQLGRPSSPHLHGSNLAHLARSPGRFVYAESFPCLRYGKVESLNRRQRAVLQEGFKLIVSTSGQKELYDLSSDPSEQHNLYGSPGTPTKDLEEKLLRWVASAPVHKPPASSVSRESIERLRSLGYVQ